MTTVGKNSSGQAYAGPATRKLARELGVPLAQIQGTAPDGRIHRGDVKAFARRPLVAATAAAASPVKELPSFADMPIRREPLTGIARATAENMHNAWQQIPHAWLQVRTDVSQLENTRQQLRADTGQRLSLNAFLIKGLALAMVRFPKFNACYDAKAQELVYKGEVNVGLAVDTPRGLLVPVIRHADRLGLDDISAQIAALAQTGRNNRLSLEQLRGGGMTLSSLGSMEIDSLCPLVNWPEVAILGAGQVRVEPVWDGSAFSPRQMLNLVLGFDHRVINGADGARFLQQLKRWLENPIRMALDQTG